MKLALALTLGIALAGPSPLVAQHAGHGAGSAATASAALADGEIRKVDKDAKKITIKHGPIANLDMPPMTMVFQVKDPALLDTVKAGDKVRFRAEKEGGAYVVTKVEK
jgi:Cu/Ag efflux protein CusF